MDNMINTFLVTVDGVRHLAETSPTQRVCLVVFVVRSERALETLGQISWHSEICIHMSCTYFIIGGTCIMSG